MRLQSRTISHSVDIIEIRVLESGDAARILVNGPASARRQNNAALVGILGIKVYNCRGEEPQNGI